MKIDFLINKMSGGGAERVVSILANNLAKRGFIIRIITFQGQDNYNLEPSIERIKLHNHPFFQSVVINGFFGLLKFYRKKKNRPDVMSSHINLLGYMTIPIAKIYGLKIIASEHINHISGSNFAKKFLRSYLYPFADAITILTAFDLDYFTKKKVKVHLIPNPCPFEIVETRNIKENNSKEIIAIGDLNRYHHKGFDNLIDIAEKVIEKNPEWTFKIVGGGEIGLDILKKEVIKRKLENNVLFTGYRTDIKELLSKCEIFILSSRFEGLPMTLLEAMSQGVCCIAYDCISGPSDVITNQLDGLLIPNQDKQEMIKGIQSLISSAGIREKYANNAPLALEKFSIEQVGNKWVELLKDL